MNLLCEGVGPKTCPSTRRTDQPVRTNRSRQFAVASPVAAILFATSREQSGHVPASGDPEAWVNGHRSTGIDHGRPQVAPTWGGGDCELNRTKSGPDGRPYAGWWAPAVTKTGRGRQISRLPASPCRRGVARSASTQSGEMSPFLLSEEQRESWRKDPWPGGRFRGIFPL